MFPFRKLPSADAVEKKALLYAVVCSLLYICFLIAVRPPTWDSSRVHVQSKRVVVTSEPPPSGDPLEIYRVKTEAFRQIDFWNYSYGPYKLTGGKTIPLTLVNSVLELPNNSDSFSLKDVYYRDVTGDGESEAIVWLSHWQCAGLCDGGSNLFYIYTARDGKLKTIWQYESGSYAYGCGLKSFTVSGRQIVLELLGNCPEKKTKDSGPSRFMTADSTFILLEFDGTRFVQQSSEVVETPSRSAKNFEPAIRIF